MPRMIETIAAIIRIGNQSAARHLHKRVGHRETEAGDVEHADHDPRHGADHDELNDQGSGFNQRLDRRHQRHALALVTEQKSDRQQAYGGPKRRRLRQQVEGEQAGDNDDEGHEVMPARAQYRPAPRDLVALDRLEAVAAGHQIGLNEQCHVIQNGRDERGEDDVLVRDFEEFGHQERGRAHHRRHQLATGRCHRLDGSGLVALVAALFHQRDGDHAGGHHVRYRAARNRPEMDDAVTAIFAAPPRYRPIKAVDMSVKKRAPPDMPSRVPK